MGKTAASGAKTSGPTSATVVLAGALGCFAAGYGAHSLGSATKTIQKVVQSRVPAAIKNLLPRFSTASSKLKGELAHQFVKPAQNAPSMHAAVVAEKTEAVVLVNPEEPLKEPNELLGNDEQEEKRADTNESKLATATREGLPEAEISDKPTVCPSSDANASLGTASTTSTAID